MFVAILLPPECRCVIQKSALTILLRKEFFFFFVTTHRQMNLHLFFITSCVIFDVRWSLYYLIHKQNMYDFGVARIANDLCKVFLCILQHMRYANATAGNLFDNILTIGIRFLTTTSTIYTHTHTHFICWYFLFSLLFLLFLYLQKCIQLFHCRQAIFMQFAWSLLFSTMFESLQKPCASMIKKNESSSTRWTGGGIFSFIRSFAFIVKCSLLRLSKSLSFQLIAITWFQCSLPR